MASEPAKPQARVDVEPILEAALKSLQDQAQAEQEARLQGNQAKWMMPPSNNWSGDLFDVQGIEQAFDRNITNDAFTAAIADPSAPGTTGDLVAASLQVDYLAVMERAFRSRHLTRARAMCHAMGRKTGHGDNKGPLTQAVLEYVRGVVKESKSG